ncbi:MAG: peptidyl-prolyl cis-trans isomerase A (cyclophilin A) [Myxococcota bacterium]|jgi:peptidyl-prolyl cis-trans isomerase A (cyclophilin A)
MMTKILSGVIALACVVGLSSVASAQSRATANTKVQIETNKGTILVELEDAKAPITVKNFLEYVDAKYYDATIFHRVIKGFMVQGGGFTQDMKKKPTRAAIKLETGISNKKGTLAMARTAVKDSATSQFFINHADNARLDNYGGGYAVFGKVIKGMEVVEAIATVSTARKSGHGDVPVEPIIIKSITRVK